MNGSDQAVAAITLEGFAALRSEIVHAQEMGSDFLKWKLIGAASVASLGLGFGVSSSTELSDASLLICLIPLICAYVDLARLDLVIRIVVIARFLSINGDGYELFVDELRRSPTKAFRFAPMAVHLSSAVMNVLIIGAGTYGWVNEWPQLRAYVFIGSGFAGLLATLVLWKTHNSMIQTVSEYKPKSLSDRPAA